MMQSNGRAPIGYVDLEGAVEYAKYSPAHIKDLARKNKIFVIERDSIQYFSTRDLILYGKVPEGHINYKEGSQQFNYSNSYFGKLVKNFEIPTTRVLGVVYFSVKDFEQFLKIPDGYESLDEACKTSTFSRDTMRKLLNKEKVEGFKKWNMWYISKDSLKEYEIANGKKNNGKVPSTRSIDSLVST
ncbi:MAG TPA: hypothetical protein QF458_04925 [Candidatus Woesearchaeota archaeon]|jgi:hypothetical protein|nr:hypothetical protein [Candidatus Woesearchaeota archaeon]